MLVLSQQMHRISQHAAVETKVVSLRGQATVASLMKVRDCVACNKIFESIAQMLHYELTDRYRLLGVHFKCRLPASVDDLCASNYQASC